MISFRSFARARYVWNQNESLPITYLACMFVFLYVVSLFDQPGRINTEVVEDGRRACKKQ